MDISRYKRNSNKFSFTDTFGSLVGNSEFGEGYIELKNKKHNEKTYIWEMLSAVSEEIGETLYENVLNYIDNVSNIDTCNVKALKSIAEMLGTEDFFFFNSVDKIPLDILNLINIFSIKRRYLLNSSLIDSKLVNEIILNTFNFNDITDTERSIESVRNDNITQYGSLLSSDEDLDLSAKAINVVGSINDDKFTEFVAKAFYNVIAEHITDTYVSFDDISAKNGSIDYSCLSTEKDGHASYELNFVALNIKKELSASNKTGLRNIFDSQDTLLDSQISVLRKNSDIPPNIDFRFIAYKIDKGIDSIEEYSEDEQKIINLILENWSRTSRIKGSDVLNIGQLSSNEFKYVPLLQTRYAIYKEQLVKSYINYIEDIFQLSSSGSLNNIFKSFNNDSPYELDKNYTDITYKIADIDIRRTLYDSIKEENLIALKYPDQDLAKHYSNPIIKNVSAILAKICLVIANIREQLKSQAQKNHMIGTRLLLEYILSRYIKSKIENNIYPSLSGNRPNDLNLDVYKYDRYDPTTGAIKTEYANGGKFFVNIIEFDDLTEYYNLENKNTEAARKANKRLSRSNPRFYDDLENGTSFSGSGTTLSRNQISSFYMDNLNLKSDLLGDSEFYDFLSSIYDLGNNAAYVGKDGVIVIPSESSKETEKLEAAMFLKYHGLSAGFYPWYNFKNQLHSSRQFHPFIYQFIEHEALDSVVNNAFYNLDNEKILRLLRSEKLSTILGEFGNWLNVWKNNLLDYSGYMSRYENSTHTIASNSSLGISCVDYDGTFYPPAVEDFLETFQVTQKYDSDGKLNKRYYLKDVLATTYGFDSFDDIKDITSGNITKKEQYKKQYEELLNDFTIGSFNGVSALVYGPDYRQERIYFDDPRTYRDWELDRIYAMGQVSSEVVDGKTYTIYTGRLFGSYSNGVELSNCLDDSNEYDYNNFYSNQTNKDRYERFGKLKSYWSKWYSGLHLTEEFRRRLRFQIENYYDRLSDVVEPKIKVKGKTFYDIYAYGLDKYKNSYILYKNYLSNNIPLYGDLKDEFRIDSYDQPEIIKKNTPGELWFKYKDHPIGFPAFGPVKKVRILVKNGIKEFDVDISQISLIKNKFLEENNPNEELHDYLEESDLGKSLSIDYEYKVPVPFDIAFWIDSTGSLDTEIASLKTSINTITNKILSYNPDNRVAFYQNKYNNNQNSFGVNDGMLMYGLENWNIDSRNPWKVDFTNDKSEISTSIRNLKYNGGDENLWNLYHIVEDDPNLHWRENSEKLVIAITDEIQDTYMSINHQIISANFDYNQPIPVNFDFDTAEFKYTDTDRWQRGWSLNPNEGGSYFSRSVSYKALSNIISFDSIKNAFNKHKASLYFFESQNKGGNHLNTKQLNVLKTYNYRLKKDLIEGIQKKSELYSIEPEVLAQTIDNEILEKQFKKAVYIGLPLIYDFEFTPSRNGIMLAAVGNSRINYDYSKATIFASKIEQHYYFTSFVSDNAAFSSTYRRFSPNENDFLNGYDFLGFYLNDSSLYAAYLQKNIENNLITSVDFNVVQFIPENPYVPVQFKYDNRNNRLRIKMSESVPVNTEFSLGYSNGRFSLIYNSNYRTDKENLDDLSIQNYIGYNSYNILSGMRGTLLSAGHDLSGWTFRQLGLGDLSGVEKIDDNGTSFDRFEKKFTYINIFETYLQDPDKASETEKPYAMNYVLNSDASYIPLYSGVRGQIKVWSVPSYDKSKQQSIELLGYEYHDLDDKYSEETKGIFYDDKFGVSTDMALNTNFDATLRVYEDFDPNDYVKIIYNKFIPPIPYEVNGQETNPNQFTIEQTGFDLSGLTCTNINDLSIVVINTETPNAKPILSCPLSAFKNPNSLSINYNGDEITESEQFIYEHGYPDQENTRVYGTLNVFDSDPYNEHMSDLMSKSIVNRIFNVKDILISASGINSTNINDFRLTLKFVLDRERLKTSAFRTTGMAVSSRKLAVIVFDTKLTQFEKYHYLEPFDKWPYFNFDGKLSDVLSSINDELDLSTKYAYSLALFGNTKATINGLKRVFKNMNLFDKQLDYNTTLVKDKLEAFFMKTGRKFLQNDKIAKNASGTKYDEFNIANGVLSTELENLDLAKYTIINQLSSVPYIRTNQITFKQSEQDEVQHTYPMLVVEDIIQDIFKRSFGGNEVKQNNIYQLSNTYIFQLENPFRIANILSSVPVPRYSYREHYARVYEEYIGAQFSVDINGPDLVNYVKLYHDISGDYKSTMPLSDLNAAHLADHTNVYTKTASGTNIITPTMPANGQFTGANATISANVAIPPEDGPRGEFGWPTRFMTVGGYNNPRSFADESRDTLSPPIPDGYNYTVDNSDASFEEVEEETLNPNDLQTGHIDIADSNIFVQMAKHKTTAREIDDFLKLYVCYKYVGENDSRKTIRLYFNTQNMTNTPYLYQREDGLFASEYKAKTSLVLDSGSDGILNVVLQYRFIDIYGDVQGVSTVPVARYHIYNVSDDKPKFLISRIWSITDNADDIDVSFYADFATVTPEHKYYGPEFLSSFVSENFKLKDDILCYNTFEVESNNGISALTCDFIYDTGYTSEGNNEFALVKPLCENVKSITFGNGYTGDIDGSGYASIVLSGYRANIGFILKEGTFIPPNTFKKNYNIQLLSANAVDAEGNRVKVFVKHGSMLFDFIGNNSLLYGRYLARELNYSKTEGPLKDSRDVLPTTNNKDNNSGWILTEAEQKLINIYNGGNDSDGSGPYGSNDLQFIIMLQDGNKLQFASNTNRYSAQPVYM